VEAAPDHPAVLCNYGGLLHTERLDTAAAEVRLWISQWYSIILSNDYHHHHHHHHHIYHYHYHYHYGGLLHTERLDTAAAEVRLRFIQRCSLILSNYSYITVFIIVFTIIFMMMTMMIIKIATTLWCNYAGLPHTEPPPMRLEPARYFVVVIYFSIFWFVIVFLLTFLLMML
jgi:hypothetical protein